jgi:hypothetical protein
MALIKCPECGKDVSDSCERCIHCGYSINKCPECGTLVSKDETVCSNCGKNLQEKAPEAPKENSVEPKIDLEGKDSFTVWENLNPEKKQKRKILKLLDKNVNWISAVLGLLFIFLSSMTLKDKGIMGYPDIKGYIVIGSVFLGISWFTISLFSMIRDYYTEKEFTLWCEANNIDPTEDLIKRELNPNPFDNGAGDGLLYASYYKKDKNILNSLKTELIIEIAFGLFRAILVALIVKDNFIQISSMLAKLVEFKFDYFYWETTKVVLLIISAVITIVGGIIYDLNSKVAKWRDELIRKAKEEQKSENSENK